MYAKVKDSQIVQYPYGYAELQSDNLFTNFNGVDLFQAFQGTDTNLAGYILETVIQQEQPQYSSDTQVVSLSSSPVLEAGQWVLQWAIRDKTAEELAQRDSDKASSVRSERNDKLRASDWTQVADAHVNQATWAAYRQALRDITAQAGFPWAIDWPIQP